MSTAKINKQTVLLVLSEKKISNDYLISKIKTASNPSVFIQQLLDENSDFFPTIRQAKELANLLRIPFVSLYMTSDKISPFLHKIPNIQNRLTLDSSNDESLINLAISDILYSYDFYLQTTELLENKLINFSFNNKINEDKIEVADVIRDYFEISLDMQYKIKSPRQLYLYLKDLIESKGIFIQEFSGVDVTVIRAFAIYDSKFQMPIIAINSNDSTSAKSFSLIHELVHILKGTSSLCNGMDNSYQQNQEEIFCNAVAGEALAPTDAIKIILNNVKLDLTSLDDIKKIADKFSVSREVVLRRLMDLGEITQNEYNTLTNMILQQFQQQKEEEKIKRQAGIKTIIPKRMDWEAFNKSSIALSKTLLTGYYEDVFTKSDISQILSIKPRWVDGYLQEVAKWNK